MLSGLSQGRVNLKRLVGRIRAEFPDLRFEAATLNDLGEDHAVVLLDDRWVFRFPRSAKATEDGRAERRLLAALNEISPVATPRYQRLSAAGDFGGYRIIAGRELTEAVFAALPRATQERVLAEIGGFLRVLHALSPELVDRPGGGATTEDAAWFSKRYAEQRSRLGEALGADLKARADRFYEALPRALATDEAVVIHRDLTEDHILLDPDANRLAGIIDFTDAALGDPAFDFTFLWAYGHWAPAHAALSYGVDTDALLIRSLWWFTRYRIDQIWWSISGARAYDVARITAELRGLFDRLGL